MDQNPVRAGLAGRGTEYPWSSTRGHVERKDPAGLLDLEAWRQIDTSGDWADVLGHLAEDAERRKLWEATRSGRPLGEQGFVEGLEREFRQRLRSHRPGPQPLAKRAKA